MAKLAVQLPPGSSAVMWQTVRYLRDPVGMILKLAERYGDPFTVPTVVRPMVVTGNPDAIKTIFAADPDTFQPFSVESMVPILGQGSILLQHGAPHKRARKLMQPPFHGQRMRAYGAAIADTARRHLDATPVGKSFPVENVFRDISLDVIIRTIFGVDGSERVTSTRQAVLATVGAFGPLVAMFKFLRRDFGGLGPWARFRRLLEGVHQLLRDEIAARRAGAPGEDVLSLLVAARDEAGQPMDDQEIVEQLFTMVIAGHETTATALAWAVDEVMRDAALVERLRDELRPLGGDPDRLAAAPLLDAACAETLRLHPLIPVVGRNLLRPFELCGYSLPPGVGVGACLVLAHRRPDVYPEPDVFRPERFLERTYSPFEYLPWGGGARRCLGAAFALYEMKIVLGILLTEYGVTPIKPRATTEARPATVGPRGKVPVIRKA